MRIILIATEWGSNHGGINSFNTEFASALAKVGANDVQVFCALGEVDETVIEDAASSGVTLIQISLNHDGRPADGCIEEIESYLQTSTGVVDIDLWIGHDMVTGPVAKRAFKKFGGNLALIHHMDYRSYQNIQGCNGKKTAANHADQVELFSTPEAILFGVGSDLAKKAAGLAGKTAYSIVPGFPCFNSHNFASNHSLEAMAAGRFDNQTEPVKQLRLAVAGWGEAVKQAGFANPAFRDPVLSIFGVDPEIVSKGKLEKLANKRADRKVTVVPTEFGSSDNITKQLLRSNLAIMPSFREGFGLIGWEAIGAAVPLILGRETGLYRFIEQELGGAGTGCLNAVSLVGGELNKNDINVIAQAIINIAGNIEKARKDASHLRQQLITKFGCTWEDTAKSFLKVVAKCGRDLPWSPEAGPPASVNRSSVAGGMDAVICVAPPADYHPNCANLRLDSGQGVTPQRFDILATLRMGQTEFRLKDLDVAVGVRRAMVEVTAPGGQIEEDRLGDGPGSSNGVRALAGDIWEVVSSTGEAVMTGKVLGDDALCRVKFPQGQNAQANVEVWAARSDIETEFKTPTKKLQKKTKKVMSIFLKRSLYHKRTGHVLLCSGAISVDSNND